jgi:hypothetical protein
MPKAVWSILVAVLALTPHISAAAPADRPAFARTALPPAANVVRLAESGDAKSQTMLGYMYETGRGIPQNYHYAAKWYTRAAQQGDVGAQYLLGFLFDRGFGVPADHIEAQKWLILAAAGAGPDKAEIYVRMRNAIATKLTRSELDEAQYRASCWVPVPER